MIFERLAEEGNPHRDVTREHLEKFGADGLRTLCLAYRELSPQLYAEWNERFIQAKTALREREKRLDEVPACLPPSPHSSFHSVTPFSPLSHPSLTPLSPLSHPACVGPVRLLLLCSCV